MKNTRREFLNLLGKGSIVATGVSLAGPAVVFSEPKKLSNEWKRYYIGSTEMEDMEVNEFDALRAMERAKEANKHSVIKGFSRDIAEEKFQKEVHNVDMMVFSAYMK